MLEYLKRARDNFRAYIYDPTKDLKDRSFVVFSSLVLVALFLAVPCGLIMKEPPIATISTLIGAVSFSTYVIWAIRKNRIARAKIVISVLLVFVFLPTMFFTNGGAPGGAPTWLLLGTIYIVMILGGRMKIVMLILNIVMTTITWIIGYLYPDLVTEYSRGANYFDAYAGIFIVGAIVFLLFSFQITLFKKDEEHKNLRKLFEQTATSLASAIDAKDEYTKGHSARVAEYSRKIAEFAGMTPSECEDVYYVALLHDVGKIGIPESIINKAGKLTAEEYETMKQHPVIGNQILSGITELPYLSIGARYHHERYDGKGYPDHLKGDDIPEIARIISVADAYDAMTSKRSYRETIPQQSVREEIVKGSGTQFDPKYAKIMQHLIDMDTEYEMRERGEAKALESKMELVSKGFREDVSGGILITREICRVAARCDVLDTRKPGKPAIILYDSLDGLYHDDPRDMRELNYFEYAEIWLDGDYRCVEARKIRVDEINEDRAKRPAAVTDGEAYELEAVKYKDHLMIYVRTSEKTLRVIVALPDCARYAYMCFAGENCHIYEVKIDKEEQEVPESHIPRIAEEISYIDGPVGDVPSVQIDGYRTGYTEAIPITNGMEITFRTKSLPTARLIWHCPYMIIYWSEDKIPQSTDYKEYALIRLDGEYWEAADVATNKMICHMLDSFGGWDAWKKSNKDGYEVRVSFRRKGNEITTTTENLGISLRNVTTIKDERDEVYLTLTGDQCVLTNIRIRR